MGSDEISPTLGNTAMISVLCRRFHISENSLLVQPNLFIEASEV